MVEDDVDDRKNLGGSERPPESPFEKELQRSGRFSRTLKIALIAGVVLVCGIAALSIRHHKENHEEPVASEPAFDAEEQARRADVHDFILTDSSGQKKKLSEYRGSVVILSFWASWCGPCLMELPTFAELERKYHDRGLQVLAVNVDDGDDGKNFAPEFWKKKSLSFSYFFDEGKAVAQQFQIDTLPSNFVIDRKGRLAFSGFGANDWSGQETTGFIESLLNEK
jgi:thiol-disulfide isomerase/thioredoxin